MVSVVMAAVCLFASMAGMSVHSFSPNPMNPMNHRFARDLSVVRSSSAAAAPSTATASALESLAKLTTLSIDSGDLDVVKRYADTGFITDATTNPLFVSQAAENGDDRYEDMVSAAIAYAKKQQQSDTDSPGEPNEDDINLAIDKLAVNLGAQLTQLVRGRVSTEVDIRLSFDVEASVSRARRIIKLYERMGIPKDRILIKLAGTYEGIQAAKILEAEGIQCNITLVFSFWQAVAAAQAGAYLISPFPGRILDWHKSKRTDGTTAYHPDADPGVVLVKRMYAFYRRYWYNTICMPASWRPSRGVRDDIPTTNVDEILALAGVDEMTIPPPLLDTLLKQCTDADVSPRCHAPSDAATCTDADIDILSDRSVYDQYWLADQCGQDKLEEGINAFTMETEKLRQNLINRW